jgi:hypothetical protein
MENKIKKQIRSCVHALVSQEGGKGLSQYSCAFCRLDDDKGCRGRRGAA